MKNNATSSDKYVFISYKSEEKELADRIKSFLEQHGFKWWMAPDSLNQVGTQDYSNDIFSAIRGCSCLIFAVSSSSLSSKWVNREVRYALDKCEKPIIPFVVVPVPERIKEENSLYITMMLEKQILNGDGAWDMEKVLMPYLHRIFDAGGVIGVPLGQTASSRGLTSSCMTERIAGTTTTITLPGGAEMEMIYCPPGEFMMGSPESETGRHDDEIQHYVKLTKGFWLGKYPVTQAQWKSVMGSNPSEFRDDDRPEENVSWVDCQEFITKVNASLGCVVRLPTEAEWEYACRAGTMGTYGGGGGLDEMGWYLSNSSRFDFVEFLKASYLPGYALKKYFFTKGREQKMFAKCQTHPVGQKKPNAYGLYDMHGNVYEWCNDTYGDYPSEKAIDPTGPVTGRCRVLRGGCWNCKADDCRSSCRNHDAHDRRSSYYGFRLCCPE